MSSKARTHPFNPKSNTKATEFFEVKPGHKRFAAVLRTASGLRDPGHVLFQADGRRSWTPTFETNWHRYIGRMATHIVLDATGNK
jgi:hypothetical protein